VFGYIRFGLFSVAHGQERAMPLTRRQKEILDYLQSYIHKQGYAPSFEEIAEHFAFRSLATVHEHLTNLERKGYIQRGHNESRAIEMVPVPGQTGATELPLLGQVAAGEPIEAVVTPESIAVPNDLIPRRGNSYVLRVRGESMIDEHIESGDFVVVHGRDTADNGEMVVALVDGTSATVKRLYREPGGWIRLQPANETVRPIRVHEDNVLIQGVVVGVIRKY
jgi:repressor LexA